VCNSARHNRQAVPFLGLLNLCLELPPFRFHPFLLGDIDAHVDGACRSAIGTDNRLAEQGKGAEPARLGPDVELDVGGAFAARNLGHDFPGALPVRGVRV